MIGSGTLFGVRWDAKRLLTYSLLLVAAAIIVALAMLQPAPSGTFPAEWNLHLREPIDAFQSWVISHRAGHPVFQYFFEPLSSVIDWGLRTAELFLLSIPWPIVIAAFALFGYWLSGWRLALLSTAGLLFMGLVGLWTESMQTLAP